MIDCVSVCLLSLSLVCCDHEADAQNPLSEARDRELEIRQAGGELLFSYRPGEAIGEAADDLFLAEAAEAAKIKFSWEGGDSRLLEPWRLEVSSPDSGRSRIVSCDGETVYSEGRVWTLEQYYAVMTVEFQSSDPAE